MADKGRWEVCRLACAVWTNKRTWSASFPNSRPYSSAYLGLSSQHGLGAPSDGIIAIWRKGTQAAKNFGKLGWGLAVKSCCRQHCYKVAPIGLRP